MWAAIIPALVSLLGSIGKGGQSSGPGMVSVPQHSQAQAPPVIQPIGGGGGNIAQLLAQLAGR